MCCAWQTHLGRRKTLAKSSNGSLQIPQLLSSLVQGLRESNPWVFAGERGLEFPCCDLGTERNLLQCESLNSWLVMLIDHSAEKRGAPVSTSPPNQQKKKKR